MVEKSTFDATRDALIKFEVEPFVAMIDQFKSESRARGLQPRSSPRSRITTRSRQRRDRAKRAGPQTGRGGGVTRLS